MMTIKKQLFALQYIKAGTDIEAAAQKCNISTSLAKRYLKADDVKDYISTLNGDIEEVLKINKTVIVQKQLDIHDSAMKGDKRYDKEGNKLDRKPDRAAASRSLENVSKMMGYDAPRKVDVNVDLSVWLTQQQQVIEAEVIDE